MLASEHAIRCAWCLNGEPCPNYDQLLMESTIHMERLTPEDAQRFDRVRSFASVESTQVGDVITIRATEPPTTTDHGCVVTGHMEGDTLVIDKVEDLPPEEKK